MPSERIWALSSSRLLAKSTGSSLIEALVAAAVVVTVTAGVAHLLIWSRRAVWTAGVQSTATTIAAQKIEQLRALDWYVDVAGVAVSDSTTDLSADPPTSNGSGLQPSPGDALERNTRGFVDYVDAGGRSLGPDLPRSSRAAYVRRWSIAPLQSDMANSLVLRVLVLPLEDAHDPAGRLGRGARLQTIRTRLAQ
jgi:hypothetical protein